MQKLESSRQAGQEISTKWAGCGSTHTFSAFLPVSSDLFELFSSGPSQRITSAQQFINQSKVVDWAGRSLREEPGQRNNAGRGTCDCDWSH